MNEEANVLVCPLWERRNTLLDARKINCVDCGADISMHPENAPRVARGFSPVCVQCFVRRALAATNAGERVAQLLDDSTIRGMAS